MIRSSHHSAFILARGCARTRRAWRYADAMLYTEALDYLYSLANYERIPIGAYTPETLNLDRMRNVLARLGNPQERYRTIHVAGTKGKGSTCALMASCLKQLGLKVGLYTSPHLSSFRERIQVNGSLIAPEEVGVLAQKVKEAAEEVPGLTTFEAITAMGFLHFSRQDVDWAVIEVGLGGRLDATNVITPQAAVITSISYDHQHILGNTLSEIATEKAGIIKPGVPVISQAQPAAAMAVIERVAQERGAPLTVIGRHWRWTPGPFSLVKQSFEIKKVSLIRSNEKPFVNDLEGWYEIALLGKHQIENAATVIATVDVIRDALLATGAHDFGARAVRDGLRLATWPGRFEILRADPPVVADGAHNLDSANKLAATLAEVFPGRRWTFIFGTLRDKDAEGMIKALNPRATRWIFSQQSGSPRAVPAEHLLAIAAQANIVRVVALPDLADALDIAVKSDEPVCIFGSVAFVGEARVKWAQLTGAETLPACD
ncbi:MAG: folylpolyglutamate synthase/dihydrofolate synthase family protein [Anaerolineae bacterium]|nr:bifunctional folylpolyglutamate synthase/dihydrofolate synthase [Candidatus Roseilinea sp.]MDW8451025.1 folylpolyglutamate synthase/dihydrofolate synthase family protein [Anaerolineae bacterium]